ncbi:basic proline-rich protein-like [Canis lupus familiaris]|uniref:basic proline-rich protein-like n=1 Tax=Canis lupus familiaris TaxID=9615 RepID=UPI0018F7DD5E|nr:basic proline-rich protein-like [Canis lupus familiaris]
MELGSVLQSKDEQQFSHFGEHENHPRAGCAASGVQLQSSRGLGLKGPRADFATRVREKRRGRLPWASVRSLRGREGAGPRLPARGAPPPRDPPQPPRPRRPGERGLGDRKPWLGVTITKTRHPDRPPASASVRGSSVYSPRLPPIVRPAAPPGPAGAARGSGPPPLRPFPRPPSPGGRAAPIGPSPVWPAPSGLTPTNERCAQLTPRPAPGRAPPSAAAGVRAGIPAAGGRGGPRGPPGCGCGSSPPARGQPFGRSDGPERPLPVAEGPGQPGVEAACGPAHAAWMGPARLPGPRQPLPLPRACFRAHARLGGRFSSGEFAGVTL